MNFKTFAYSVLDKRIERATGFETARALVEGAGQRLEPAMTALDAIVKSYPTIEDIIVNYARDWSYAKN